jgi:tetrahydromethanopterin S-methyltransferase subunit D
MLFILLVDVSSIRAAGLATSLAVLFLVVAMAKSFPITKRTMGVHTGRMRSLSDGVCIELLTSFAAIKTTVRTLLT